MRISSNLFVVAALAALMACGGIVDDAPVSVGEDDTAITLSEGNILRVELESIPTAGYEWIIIEQPDFLLLQTRDTLMADPENQSQPGFTGGNHIIVHEFDVTAVGTGTLKMVEARSWELRDGQPPVDTWTLDVTVEAK